MFGETLERIVYEAQGACTVDLFPFREFAIYTLTTMALFNVFQSSMCHRGFLERAFRSV